MGAVDLFFKGQTGFTSAVISGGSLVVMAGSVVANSIPITANGTVALGTPTSSLAGYGEVTIVCFARGTRIETPNGEVTIESLAAGDLVLTASGEPAPVRWIGRRRTDCKRHPEPRQVWPVRIKAGAFGPNLPRRDLLVSPQHGIFDEGVLIPAKCLVNGTTIVQEPADQIEYFHIELERHDLLLAEGLPAESYLDVGDRAAFENGGGAMVLHPDFSRWAWDARACAEIKVTGPELDTVRAKLTARADAMVAADQPTLAAAG